MHLLPSGLKLPESFKQAEDHHDIVSSLCELFIDVISGEPNEEMATAFENSICEFDCADLLTAAKSGTLFDFMDRECTLTDCIEYAVDVHYESLRRWACIHYEYIEEAVEQGLVDTSNFDFHHAIQSGQMVYYRVGMISVVEHFEQIVELFEDEINEMISSFNVLTSN